MPWRRIRAPGSPRRGRLPWRSSLTLKPCPHSGPSVAVLPFLNMAGDPEGDLFADGMTEDVIAQLSRIRALKVISRISVMAFKDRQPSLREIGARLQAATLLDGSVRRIGDRVRIVAQLIDAESDRHLWSETYDRQMTDIFAIQSDVALRIAGSAAHRADAGERRAARQGTDRQPGGLPALPAGTALLRPLHPRGLPQGHRVLRAGPEPGSGYAQAYTGLALAHTELGMMGQTREGRLPGVLERAKRYAARALELDSGLGRGPRGPGLPQLRLRLRLGRRRGGVPPSAGAQSGQRRLERPLRPDAGVAGAVRRGDPVSQAGPGTRPAGPSVRHGVDVHAGRTLRATRWRRPSR